MQHQAQLIHCQVSGCSNPKILCEDWSFSGLEFSCLVDILVFSFIRTKVFEFYHNLGLWILWQFKGFECSQNLSFHVLSQLQFFGVVTIWIFRFVVPYWVLEFLSIIMILNCVKIWFADLVTIWVFLVLKKFIFLVLSKFELLHFFLKKFSSWFFHNLCFWVFFDKFFVITN